MFFVCVTVGLVILASKYRENVIRGVKQLCQNIRNPNDDDSLNENNNNGKTEISLDRVILADSLEKCDYAVQRICCNLSNGVLGFDCEWVNEGAVSLLQLATYNGVCALFRLGKIGYVPAKLKQLLSNKCILKVGVAPYEDGQKLTNDYGCRVFGTVDLRTLADRLGVPSRKGLAALTLEYLKVEMDKILEVRCGDWNADVLTEEQTAYAAYDAIASVLIYHKIQQKARAKRSIWKNWIIYIKSVWNRNENKRIHEVPKEIIDVRFKQPQSLKCENNNSQLCKTLQKITNNNVGSPRKVTSLATRKEPLYHNCYLEAPDGELLCTCDRKKAEWYVSKNLGEVVKKEPYTVRLNFEPSGRAFGQVGEYYTQIKINQCVVCGSTENFIKKNVVPREYRKYFPLVMKAHQSHDVLLLCPNCHEISNRRDLELRRELADMCNAPLTRSSNPSNHGTAARAAGHHSREWTKFFSALKALKDDDATIPLRRRKQLETEILEYTGLREITPGLPKQLYQQFKNQIPTIVTSSSLQGRCQPHGAKVVSYFTNREGGLVELEKMWREHFLKHMKPQHLPKLWSVSHNQERLVIRQTQKRIEPHDAEIAGLTEHVVHQS